CTPMKHRNCLDCDPGQSRRHYRSFPLLVLVLTTCLRAGCVAQTLADKPLANDALANEVLDRANQLRAIVPVADPSKHQRDQVLSALGELEETARAGQSYLALYRLQSLWTSIQPAQYSSSRAGIAEAGLPAFEKSWRRLATELKSQEASINRDLPPRLPT